jgi:hypothetical protein
VDTIQNEKGVAGMIWLPLESEMLASVAYDADQQILYLRFRKTGDVYRYFDFPAAVRDHFRYQRMAKLHAA